MSPTLADLESLARRAGEILRQGVGAQMQMRYKDEIELVTEYDHRSEAFLLDEIQRRFPGQRVVSEESGGLDGEDSSVWYIDPLDGTVNFAHGVPLFSVSIAYAENGHLRLGAVYAPVLEECFCAQVGQGATLNGRSIQASGVDNLRRSLLVTGFPYDIASRTDNNLKEYAHFSQRCQGVRRLGSAAIDLCYVACGRLDGYWEQHVHAYDVAAGGLIAREAGAVVTNLAGEADFLRPPITILAAGAGIYDEMVAEFQHI